MKDKKLYTIPKKSNATKADYIHFEKMNERFLKYSKEQLECGSDLTKISTKYKDLTDKGPESDYWRKHCYTEFYGPLLSHLKNEPINILEVGVRWGGSLLSWSDFFPNAKITGLDINLNQMSKATKNEVDKRGIKTIAGNAYCNKFFSQHIGDEKFDLILDDGSHREVDQIKFFNLYKNALKKGGYLICEDFPTEQQARNVISAFDGKINNISLIIRNHCIPSTKGEIIVMYKE